MLKQKSIGYLFIEFYRVYKQWSILVAQQKLNNKDNSKCK
jgi:hypothetical protein